MNKLIFIWTAVLLFLHEKGMMQVTYNPEIKGILQQHCITCHTQDGPAPFSLETYDDVKKRSRFISYVVGQRIMPPWKADAGFRHYRNERVVSDSDIQKIRQWVEAGAPEGEKTVMGDSLTTSAKKGKLSGKTFRMPSDYTIPSNNRDDFRFFYVPTGNANDMYITGIQFLPGHKKRVHHSRIMVDTSGKMAGINGLSELDTAVYSFQKIPLADEFLYGWVPGNFTFYFPKGFGRRLPARANLLLNMHYAPSLLSEKDRSGVVLHLAAPEEIQREVKSLILREADISNQPFQILAGTKPTFYMSSGVLPNDMSLLSVQPHAHLLGKSFRSFAITPEGEVIHLVKIDNWDFDWQTSYEFERLVHIPAGSVIYMEGTYDNTQDNPRNPFFPARDIGYGWRTVDEMMNLIFYYTDYVPGDETRELVYPE